jgi:hypothetical protein
MQRAVISFPIGMHSQLKVLAGFHQTSINELVRHATEKEIPPFVFTSYLII